MSGTVTVSLMLLVIGADNDAVAARYQQQEGSKTSIQAPASELVTPIEIGVEEEIFEGLPKSSCEPCADSCSKCRHGHLPCTWKCWWCSCCNMPQHLPYYPAHHGYYYFRPYNHLHVLSQKEAVLNWGGDPRNPYSNEIFDRVYAELREEEAHEASGDVRPSVTPQPAQDAEIESLVPPPPPTANDSDMTDATKTLGEMIR